jgi:hypothetical protein
VAVIAALCVLAVCLIDTHARAQFGELIAFESPGNTTYYLDPDNGDDENRGTRPESAWKTLARVNTSRFAPGDKILLKAGATFHGKLWPKGTGIQGRPITIDSYGDGPPPAIHGDGEASATLLLENTNAWHIRNLELTNTGEQPEAFRYGISILIEDTGDAGDFVLRNLHVHGVNGTEESGLGEGAAISFSNRGTNVPTRFDGILIESCTVGDSGRNGIVIDSGSTDRARWLANLNVVIRENTIQNIRGDGIKLTGCDYAMVEYNTVAGGYDNVNENDTAPKAVGTRETADAAGIALQHCDNTLVQFNEVGGVTGAAGAAIRCGENSRANTFQFNFTHDNGGPMVRIIGDAPTAPVPGNPGGISAGNTQTTVRYNISQCDGGAFHLLGPVNEARLYNNTVYTGPESRTVAVRLADRGGAPKAVTLANNVFFTQGTATLDLGPEPDVSLLHNAYAGDCQRPENEENPVTIDLLLADPGKGISRTEGLECYQTLENSPLRGSGVRLTGHGRYDFWANPISAGAKIDIGAYQAPSDNAATPAQNTPDSAPEAAKPAPKP